MFYLNEQAQATSLYQPGVCNLGKNEIRKRYTAGVIGFGTTIIITALFYYFNFYMPYSLFINFLPLMIGFTGYYQASNKFCVMFAARGMYNFTGTANDKGRVINTDFHKLDLVKARKINVKSAVASLVVTIIIFIPFVFIH